MGKVSRTTWRVWERIFHIAFRLEGIESEERNLFFIAKRTYLGRRFTVDGETVKPFDKVIELHMDNEFLIEILQSEQQLISIAVRLLREVRRSLPALTDILRQQRFAAIRVVYGVTFLHRGVTKLGFTVLPVRNEISRRITRWHLRHVLKVVNPDGGRILATHTSVLQPMLVAVSKAQLITKYGSHSKQSRVSTPYNDHYVT